MVHETVIISGTGDTARLRRILEEHGYHVRQSADRTSGDAEDAEMRVVSAGAGDWTWRDDHEAYERHRKALGREYAGRFIAMHRGEVVGVGENARDAASDGIRRIGHAASLFVIRAGEPIPEPEQLDMQMDVPRSVEFEQ